MKNKLFILLFTLVANIGTIFASDTLVDGIWYDFYSSTKTAVVTFRGTYAGAYSNEYTGVVNIPSLVTYNNETYTVSGIGDYAFEYCSGLTSVITPNSLTSIGAWAFSNCANLRSIGIPNSVTRIGAGAFNNCPGLTSITIPDGVMSIEQMVFSDCSGLTNVEMPNSIISIEDDAFTGCSGLTSVIIPNGVTSIGQSAFFGCDGLTSIEIPNSVTSIGHHAFSLCSSLVSITIHNKVPPIYGTEAMPDYNRLKIYVPCVSVNDYKTAWSSQASRIHANPNYEYVFECQVSPANVGVVEMPINTCADTIITAVPNYGYHFVKWSDSITDNPRSIELTQDTSFTAILARNPRIRYYYDKKMGTITGDTTLARVAEGNVTFSAVPNYGYHFTKWSDGLIDNPRTIYLTRDTSFTAEFAKNVYKFSYVADETMGIVQGGLSQAEYLDTISFEAIPKKGYHFVRWSDNDTTNPRKVIVTQDQTYLAIFALNKYVIGKNAINGSISGLSQANYLDSVVLTAIPDYGYRFVEWSDGVTDNPRMAEITQDTVFSVEFAKNPTIVYSYDKNIGNVTGDTTLANSSEGYLTFSATANYGYHFTQWNDSVTDNPRTIYLTQDTAFTAEFAPNKYKVSVSCDDECGTIDGESGEFDYLTERIYTAIPNYGYNFAMWNDNVTTNPREIIVEQDTNIVAIFACNNYSIIYMVNDSSMGTVQGIQKHAYMQNVTFTAVPNEGYHFVQWSDSITDNPRTIVLTQDTAFTAEFDIDTIGTCGDDLALLWEYSKATKVLTISGEGTLNSNYTFGVEAPTQMEKLILSEGVATIGNSAFANYSTLQEISIPTTIATIHEQAFYNCTKLAHIYNYREKPCIAYSNTFDGIDKFSCTLHVPEKSIDMYKTATAWRDFYYIVGMESPEGFENINDEMELRKVIIDNQIYILRGDRVYTLQGQEVE